MARVEIQHAPVAFGLGCGHVAAVMRWAVMTIKVALEHRTSYTFDRPVRVFPHVVRLRPAPHSRTPIEAY
ncbi:MAG: transglutaminase N-terminal domain-containing protein, partial [Mycobacterium sp.]